MRRNNIIPDQIMQFMLTNVPLYNGVPCVEAKLKCSFVSKGHVRLPCDFSRVPLPFIGLYAHALTLASAHW